MVFKAIVRKCERSGCRRMAPPTALLLLGLGAFVGGLAAADPARLTPTPCKLAGYEGEARCATFEVFENRETKSGRKIGLKLAVLPAKGPQAAPDPLFIVVGGPGQAALPTAKAFSEIFADALRERDIVIVDQRGAGGSNALNCPLPGNDEDPQSYLGDMLPVDSVRACLGKLDADPALYTT